jgi:DNA-binding NarL/FixJ family response regulator
MVEPDLAVGVRELRDRGRQAYRRRSWADAFGALTAADEAATLPPEDLDLLANAAYLIGKDAVGYSLWARVYREWLHQGESAWAAQSAARLAILLMLQGEEASSNGWALRAKRLVEADEIDCPACGYLSVLDGLERLRSGEVDAALAAGRLTASTGKRFEDSDLLAFGQLGEAQALIQAGEITRAAERLDEAMVAVTAGEVSPIAAGILYCAVIDSCQAIFDLRRAHEWTAALGRWCDTQPDLVPFRGACLVHRAEIMRMRGNWSDAVDETREACERLTGHPAIGAGYYQLADLYRLRGELRRAEETYRQACRWIPDPQPGLALLRLTQGQEAAAAAAIRRALDETTGDVSRSRLLGPAVEILIAAGDDGAARDASAELRGIATRLDVSWLQAMSLTADGATLLADGDAREALHTLRRAWTAWQDLGAPYEAARVRVLMAQACQACDDPASAEMELDAAVLVFEQLGARPDVARARALSRAGAPESAGLTGRELEVLRHVAAGQTNRAIAADLILSEKTVARHVSNMFSKLGVSSRAAATAYAYEHGLL